MIERRTVFILGAGAHFPYGFPLGAQLIEEILHTLSRKHRNDFRDHLFNVFRNSWIGNAVKDFHTALDLGGHSSIDSFLVTHADRPGFSDIGLHAVAWQLLPREFRHQWTRKHHPGDWMSFLFKTMISGCHDSVDDFLEKNQVSFVTFNYDRTLEDFLTTRIAHTYNLSPTDAWKKADKLKIVHVYGSLGEFNPMVIDTLRPQDVRDPLSTSAVKSAAESIRLMYAEREGDNSEVAYAKLLIQGATCVCFLGFGFDADNIAKLQLNQVCGGKPDVFATRKGEKDGDWSRIEARMLPVRLYPLAGPFLEKGIDWDCLEFLHQTRAVG
jgi:hypothetical protein